MGAGEDYTETALRELRYLLRNYAIYLLYWYHGTNTDVSMRACAVLDDAK